jgi:hypothetical protein
VNLLAPLPDARAAEAVDILLSRPGIRIERIVSLGEASPPGFWYDQDEGEWVLLLSGSARLRFETKQNHACSPQAIVWTSRRIAAIASTGPIQRCRPSGSRYSTAPGSLSTPALVVPQTVSARLKI